MNRYLSLLPRGCAIVLGLVFLAAAFSKIGDLEDFHQSLLQIAFLPVWLQGLAVLIIPGLELTIGLCLFLPSMRREAAALAIGLLVMFLILGIIMNVTGNKSDCGCFKLPAPAWFDLTGWWVVARNVLFLILGLLALRNSSTVTVAD